MEVGKSTVGCARHTVTCGKAIMVRRVLVGVAVISVLICSLIISGCKVKL
jgi:hypothetical protein